MHLLNMDLAADLYRTCGGQQGSSKGGKYNEDKKPAYGRFNNVFDPGRHLSNLYKHLPFMLGMSHSPCNCRRFGDFFVTCLQSYLACTRKAARDARLGGYLGGIVQRLGRSPAYGNSQLRHNSTMLETTMRALLGYPVLAVLLLAAPAAAHHGWGSYNASRMVIVQGPIQTVRYANPHATVTVKTPEKVWTIILAPVSRMQARGASAQLVAVGKTVKAEGYASKVDPDEMRAERITVDGKTVEMR